MVARHAPSGPSRLHPASHARRVEPVLTRPSTAPSYASHARLGSLRPIRVQRLVTHAPPEHSALQRAPTPVMNASMVGTALRPAPPRRLSSSSVPRVHTSWSATLSISRVSVVRKGALLPRVALQSKTAFAGLVLGSHLAITIAASFRHKIRVMLKPRELKFLSKGACRCTLMPTR